VIAAVLAAWVGHTDDSRAYAQDVIEALRAAGLSHKAAAIDMGLSSEQQLSRQLAGVEPLNAFRLTLLPLRFQMKLLKMRALRLGCAVFTAEDVALLKGAAAVGPRRMAKMLLDHPSHERRVS
jgi:hypothetical protein